MEQSTLRCRLTSSIETLLAQSIGILLSIGGLLLASSQCFAQSNGILLFIGGLLLASSQCCTTGGFGKAGTSIFAASCCARLCC